MSEKTFDELYNEGFEEGNLELIETEPIKEEPQEVVLTEEELGLLEDISKKEEPQEETPENVEEETPENVEEETPEEGDTKDLEQPNTENQGDDLDNEEEDSSEGRTIKWKGQEIFIKNDEIDTFLQKGFDYTKKTQDLAKYRPFIEMINEKGLTYEDLVTYFDAKNGNTEAIAEIMKQAQVEALDIDENSTYTPKVEQKNYELNDIIEDIKGDETYGLKVDSYIAAIPDNAKQVFIENPNILKGFYEDVKAGVADKVMPEVIKSMAINPNADFLDTYQSIGRQVFQNQPQKEEVEEKETTKPEASRETKKRASISKKNNSKINDHKDIWEDDELFDKMMRMTDPMYRK